MKLAASFPRITCRVAYKKVGFSLYNNQLYYLEVSFKNSDSHFNMVLRRLFKTYYGLCVSILYSFGKTK